MHKLALWNIAVNESWIVFTSMLPLLHGEKVRNSVNVAGRLISCTRGGAQRGPRSYTYPPGEQAWWVEEDMTRQQNS